MDWDAVGAIGEVLGSVTVFVTLGYLAVQVEHAGLTLEEALLVNSVCVAWWTYTLQIIPYVDELQAMERTGFAARTG